MVLGIIALIIGTTLAQGLDTGNNLAGIVGGLSGALAPVLPLISLSKSSSDAHDLDDRLATAVWNEWAQAIEERKLLHPQPLPVRWRRSQHPVAGPVSAATGSTSTGARFDPLPGLESVDHTQLEEGDATSLHTVYGGLGSGRLLLLGPAGSGKSAAAILLLQDALRFRYQASVEARERVPVPVMFTLHGWDPTIAVIDWLADKLVESYPIFRNHDHATDMLSTGRVAVLLDGLDEMPEHTRSNALTALAGVPFRLVITSRIDEALTTAETTILAGAVALELQPIPPDSAAHYLLADRPAPPPTAWQNLAEHLTADDSDSAVHQALANPLTLSLLRDVYNPADPVDKLLDTTRFPTATDIGNHLLDHTIDAAYTPRPGQPQPPYTIKTARNALVYLATRMTAAETHDFAWWNFPVVISNNPIITSPMQPQRLRLEPRRLAVGLAFGLMGGLAGGGIIGLVLLLIFGITDGFVTGVVAGLVDGLALGLAHGLGIGPTAELCRSHLVDHDFRSPSILWRQDRNSIITLAILIGPGTGIATGTITTLTFGFAIGIIFGISYGLFSILITLLSSPFVIVKLSYIRLSNKNSIPRNMIRFLEDARARRLIRTVGPLYQFSHTALQERLASERIRSAEP
ncbi:hypothetical protein FHR84_000444 [Actinopolyspora biskrensis]|uniref:NACHT domain-containing protein n=1 Tax=Actinopolyspora biskrensis TaxID=1470178 RepID=A0A852YSP1_9ACTN|nr:hypothetical protein [Actinopolyspora biskrensis]